MSVADPANPADRARRAGKVRRAVVVVALVLGVALVAAQLLLPPLAADRVEDRLTEGGGTAEVSVSAVPAPRLLFGDGDSLEVDGRDLEFDLDPEEDPQVFERLDGFGEVDVSMVASRAGPLALETFRVTREGDEPYAVVSRGNTTVPELLSFGADRLGLPGGGALEFLGGQVAGDEPIPVELDLEVESDDGRLRVVDGGATVAGVPTGPLAEIVTAAVVVRI